MKANELMVGDWVRPTRLNKPARIEEVSRLLNRVIVITADGYESAHILECNPIPLTPEILEKNGFMPLEGGEKEDSVFYALSDMFAKVRWNGEKLTDAVFGENILYFPAKRGLRYVHELQHALRLCQIDKTIEL